MAQDESTVKKWKKLKKALPIIAIILIFVCFFVLAVAVVYLGKKYLEEKNRFDKFEADLILFSDDKNALTTRISDEETNIFLALDRIEALEGELEQSRNALADQETQITAQQTQITNQDTRIAEQDQQIDDIQAGIVVGSEYSIFPGYTLLEFRNIMIIWMSDYRDWMEGVVPATGASRFGDYRYSAMSALQPVDILEPFMTEGFYSAKANAVVASTMHFIMMRDAFNRDSLVERITDEEDELLILFLRDVIDNQLSTGYALWGQCFACHIYQQADYENDYQGALDSLQPEDFKVLHFTSDELLTRTDFNFQGQNMTWGNYYNAVVAALSP